MKILITGIAGFIGYHFARRIAGLRENEVTGIDNINRYYDVDLKYGRLADLGFSVSGGSGEAVSAEAVSARYPNLRFIRMDLTDAAALKSLFEKGRFDCVVHLAAQAGVRYSLDNPDAYIAANVQGFLNVLEAVRSYPVSHLIYASSSSVYGLDTAQPFLETAAADRPASLYAATKRSNELMAHCYSHLYGIPSTGLRFFTVYGPWGRPDMAPFLFTKAILEGQPIKVFNYGDMRRDFTYVGDIVEGIDRLVSRPPRGGEAGQGFPVPARIYNIGNGNPIQLTDFIEILEAELGMGAKKIMLPMQDGDVPVTWADCSALERDTGYRPGTPLPEGIREFVRWYRNFYGIV